MQRFICSSTLNRGRIGLLGLGSSIRFGYSVILRQSSTELSHQPAVDPPRNNLYENILRRRPSELSDGAPAREPSRYYETDRIVNQYMAFHYAEEKKYFKYDFGPKDHLSFPLRCARLCIEHMPPGVVSRALDVGCGVGRSSFELAAHFESVLGVDFSHSFVDRCNELKERGWSPYRLPNEGEIVEESVAEVSKEIDRNRVTFEQGDACNLRSDIGLFGCVQGANVLCRLPNPLDFLNRLPSLVVPGGIVVLVSPYTWLEEYTSKYLWLGGFHDPKNGDPVHGAEILKRVMSPNFDLVETKEMPFVIRETEREHQWTVSHATVWRRKGKEEF